MQSKGTPAAGALVIRVMSDGTPAWEAKWRHDGRQVKRRLGKAWVERKLGTALQRELHQDSPWRKRKGRAQPGYLTRDDAVTAMRRIIAEHAEQIANAEQIERERRQAEALRVVTLDDAAAAWLHWAERVKGMRASTLRDYRSALRSKVLPAFAGTPLAEITAADVRAWRNALLDEGLSPRTVNKLRQTLANVMVYAMREDTYRLPTNPVVAVEKVKQHDPRDVDHYEPAEVLAIARIMQAGHHRPALKHAVGKRAKGRAVVAHHPTSEQAAALRRQDEQDAALVTVLAFAGLRLGEALALRWRDVHFDAGRLVIARSYSGGVEGATKSGKERSLPMLPQVAQALDGLSRRHHATGRNDLVFVSTDGSYMDASSFRRRYRRACEIAELRPLRVHDLRHGFLSIAARTFQAHEVQRLAGHADLRTTARYLHAKPQPDESKRLSRVFAVGTPADELLADVA